MENQTPNRQSKDTPKLRSLEAVVIELCANEPSIHGQDPRILAVKAYFSEDPKTKKLGLMDGPEFISVDPPHDKHVGIVSLLRIHLTMATSPGKNHQPASL